MHPDAFFWIPVGAFVLGVACFLVGRRSVHRFPLLCPKCGGFVHAWCSRCDLQDRR